MDNAIADAAVLDRARGCLLGQLAGDALGSLVEFKDPRTIRQEYPDGVREMHDGGTWNTLAGQPTDDSEMALQLARLLVEKRTYSSRAAREAYRFWLDSGPFDCGNTVSGGLRGRPNAASQANGAMMRVSPLGIFGAAFSLEQVGNWARRDAKITHPNPVCLQANALFAMAIAHAIDSGCSALALYRSIVGWANELHTAPPLLSAVENSQDSPPCDYVSQMGWVLIAFRNALWQLLHAPSLEEAIVDTIMRGGDTDTNAAICGALLGAVHGGAAVPDRWSRTLANCRPEQGRPDVFKPRPRCFWPIDALDLARSLVCDRLQSASHPLGRS